MLSEELTFHTKQQKSSTMERMGEGITIRTIKDDLADLHVRGGGSALEQKTKKELQPIPQRAAKMRTAFIRLGIALLIVVGVAGGVYGYTAWQRQSAIPVLSTQQLAITDVIPESASMVVVYDISSDANRATTRSLWASALDQQGQASNPVTGNPTELLDVSDVTSIYFFTVLDDPAPFLVVQSTETTKNYLSQLSGVKFVENGGWLIAHITTIDKYVDDIGKGTFASSSDSALIGGSDGFVVRYIVSPSAVTQALSLPSNMMLNRKQVVFDINESASDGALHGKYQISESAVPAAVIPDTAQLTSLVPNDPNTLRVGDNFYNDILEFQKNYSVFDATTFSEPAIQQFIAKLATPYALYTRTGADGVPDTGLIIQLPGSLHAQLGHKDQVIENLLISMSPFVTGRKLDSQIVFGDGMNGGVPIRYANLEGQTAALDYTIGDDYILIATSREGMQRLSEMAIGNGSDMLSQDPWTAIVRATQDLVPSNMVIGAIKDPATLAILPQGVLHATASVLVTTKKDNTGINTHATILFTE